MPEAIVIRRAGRIEVMTTYYKINDAGLEVMRDLAGNILKVNEMAMWPFVEINPITLAPKIK